MKAYELPNETKLNLFTHKIVVTHADLTEATANTSQTIALLSVEAGDVVTHAATKLVTPFENTADSAFNSTTLVVGDGTNTSLYVSSTQLNVNGTEVLYKAGTNTAGNAYVAADTVDAVFGSMAAKSLSNLNAGEVHIFLHVAKLSDL